MYVLLDYVDTVIYTLLTDVFKFGEISDNNSNMVQDRRIVFIKVE